MKKNKEELNGSKLQAMLETYGLSTMKRMAALLKLDCQEKGRININNLSLVLQIRVNDDHKDVGQVILEYNDLNDDESHE